MRGQKLVNIAHNSDPCVTFRKMEAVVEQYNRDLAKWEQQVKEKENPTRPPEKESVRDKLRQLQAQGRQERKPRKKSQDRDR